MLLWWEPLAPYSFIMWILCFLIIQMKLEKKCSILGTTLWDSIVLSRSALPSKQSSHRRKYYYFSTWNVVISGSHDKVSLTYMRQAIWLFFCSKVALDLHAISSSTVFIESGYREPYKASISLFGVEVLELNFLTTLSLGCGCNLHLVLLDALQGCFLLP